MPTRLIREGIIASDRVNALDWAAEVFYRRLLNKVDDHGLYDARLSFLRTTLYPIKVDRVREADCSRWLAACEKAGLILLYEAAGKPYLKALDTQWQTRSEPKYPLPPDTARSQPGTVVNSSTVVEVDGVVEVDKPPLALLALPSWLDQEKWKAWVKIRPAKARTPESLKAALDKLERFRAAGHDGNAIVENSLSNGWQGLFPPDEKKNGVPYKAAPGSADRPSIKCEDCKRPAFTWTGRKCEPCHRKYMGIAA